MKRKGGRRRGKEIRDLPEGKLKSREGEMESGEE